MVQKFAKGSRVAWNWGDGRPEAKVVEHSTERIERTIKGTTQSRNGTEDNPAYVLEQSNGQTVLKLHSELEKAWQCRDRRGSETGGHHTEPDHGSAA